MILPFSTQLNGKQTMFTNKIVKGMWEHHPTLMQELSLSRQLPEHYVFEDLTVFETSILKPKLHTIREDKNDRWKPGTKIDFFINCRQPSMFRFAPVLPVVSVQEIEIKHHLDYVSIFIDKMVYEIEVCETSKKIKSTDPVTEALVQNDGFDSADDFFSYFDKDFKGKIIHWTDLKY